jgi:hypothetical protein
MRSGPSAFVESWLRRRAATPDVALLAQDTLDVLWARARRSLTELSLQALARNALENAVKEFPLLADTRVSQRGFELGVSAEAPRADLLAALGGLLVEFLALVEDTSGDILAPALEAELLRVASGRRTPPAGVRPVPGG